MGYRVVLATNPMFPVIVTHTRLRWTGLQPEEFEWVTTYEDNCYCKPSAEYYRNILEKLNLKAEECVMVGNDTKDDMEAQLLGMKTFLITDCLVNRDNLDISQWPNGSFTELMDFIRRL